MSTTSHTTISIAGRIGVKVLTVAAVTGRRCSRDYRSMST
jgi:hypothetical protein